MSTILARRLKASRAKPVLVREDSSSELDTVDLRLATLNKDIASDTWNSMDSGYDSCSTSSSSSSSDSSPNSSSIFFEEMDDLSLPDASVRSSISSSFQDEHEAASIIQCLACDESDNAIEESWQEHVYHREVTPSRSHRESHRRSKSSASSHSTSSRSRRNTPPSATVCPPSSFRPSARSSRRKQVPSSSPPSSSSSSDEDDAQYKLRSSSRLRRSKRLADCECDPLACPPSPHPQAVELCPIVQARLRTTVNPSFYLIYTLENVMMKERKIRYPLKDRATHLTFGTCRGSLALSPLRTEMALH